MSERQNSGTDVPDKETALRWEEQIDRINNTEFVSVEVKRAILVPPFRKRTNFVVRATVCDEEQHNQTRYFWFNGTNNIRESSRWDGIF